MKPLDTIQKKADFKDQSLKCDLLKSAFLFKL
jgi:hypothetical protein